MYNKLNSAVGNKYLTSLKWKFIKLFDAASDPYKTDFHIELDADLNFMMKMVLGSKLQQGLDKVVDALVDMSEGRMPEGFDPSSMKM